MSNARIEALGAGRFRISGVLNAIAVVDLLKQGRERFGNMPRIEVDLSAVSESDSAGLALLLEWLRLARLSKQQIQYTNVPAQLIALARISEIDDLLTAASPEAGMPEIAKSTGQAAPLTPKTQTA